MGFFDRFLRKDSQNSDPLLKPRKPAKDKPEEFFLDADSSSSLGDVDYMRELKTIRRTFPGNVNSPGVKEQVMEIAAETEKLEKRSQGLGGTVKREKVVDLTAGIPKTVKKTFAEKVTTKEMNERLKGTAITGVNTPAPANASTNGRKKELKPTVGPVAKAGQAGTSQKPGSIDPFKQMVRDLNK
ncbi:hypothetical protein [Synechococcus sp. M16CYN]|uniref:hypothetical protein n=1 Tax=Synechococcus sp. M16CYN TaxID=3103139 RepID=UPI0030DF084F